MSKKLKSHNFDDELTWLKSNYPRIYNKVIVYYNQISQNGFFPSLKEETVRQALFMCFFKISFGEIQPDVICKHTMNEGQAGKFQAWKKKLLGVHKGFPDVHIMLPQVKYAGMLIEFKARGEKPTKEQLDTQAALRRCGYYVVVTENLDHIIPDVVQYMTQAIKLKQLREREAENAG